MAEKKELQARRSAAPTTTRAGTTSLLAALDAGTGKVIGQNQQRQRTLSLLNMTGGFLLKGPERSSG